MDNKGWIQVKLIVTIAFFVFIVALILIGQKEMAQGLLWLVPLVVGYWFGFAGGSMKNEQPVVPNGDPAAKIGGSV